MLLKYNDNNNPDEAIVMQEKGIRFREECNGCLFYFLASLIKNLLVKTGFEIYYFKFSLPMFLACFLNLS